MICSTWKKVALAALVFGALIAKPVMAQPETDGMRFNRLAGKTVETLAPKPGGLTERIEVQSTDDHIDYVVKPFVLKKANAAEIYQWVLAAVDKEGGTVERFAPGNSMTMNAWDDIEVDYSGESLIVVTAPDWMMPGLAETIAVLDQEGFATGAYGNPTAWIRPKHRKPSELADLLSGAAASGSELIVPDDSRNILYIEDLPSWFAFVFEGLTVYDIPPTQLDTRVRIYELEDDDSSDIGLDWYAWKKSIDGGDLTVTYAGKMPGTYDLDLQSISAELSFNPSLATEFLNYLVSEGKASVVSDSRMALVNGTPGTVDVTKEIPYLVGNEEGGRGEVVFASAGVTVDIDPSIAEDTVELSIAASVDSHVGYAPNNAIPIISSSSVSTNVIMEPGKPAVLGGLTRTSMASERSGLPLLKDIPYLNFFFSREVSREHKSQIIITVLPLSMTPGATPDVDAEMLP